MRFPCFLFSGFAILEAGKSEVISKFWVISATIGNVNLIRGRYICIQWTWHCNMSWSENSCQSALLHPSFDSIKQVLLKMVGFSNKLKEKTLPTPIPPSMLLMMGCQRFYSTVFFLHMTNRLANINKSTPWGSCKKTSQIPFQAKLFLKS